MPSLVETIVAAVAVLAGVALVTVGGGVAYAGVDQHGQCGSVNIRVTEVPSEDVDDPGRYTPFESLSANQQAAFERALSSGEARVYNDTGFPRIQYEGDYYRANGVVYVCDFSTETLVAGGSGVALVGVVLVTLVGLRLRD